MRKKESLRIIIILLIVLMLFNFAIPLKVHAEGESSTTGLDIMTGIILEPTIKFFTFFVDSIMSVFSGIMTQKDIEFVMQNTPINDQTNVGATFTIENEDVDAYKNFIGVLKNLEYPNFPYSPEEIFSDKIDLLDINFISGNNEYKGWKDIRNGLSAWYKVIRMVAIIGLLSVLIYTGIKIIISSNIQEKAKYKERIINWFIAVILLFTMHYIMAFILLVLEEISTLLGSISGKVSVTMNGTTFTTNLIGLARFQMQQQHFSAKVGHFIIYIALVVYTFKFTFLYLKRVLNMAFLTLIAPIVALTYPIQKMNGKAEGLQLWLKEFMYNALLQPMHYILYYILVSSSLTLATRNPLYGIVAIAFIAHAEKLLKSIFGFGKAKAGTVGGIAGAYATGTLVSSITGFIRDPFHIGKKLPSTSNSKSKGKGNGGDSSDDIMLPRTVNDTDIESIFMNNPTVGIVDTPGAEIEGNTENSQDADIDRDNEANDNAENKESDRKEESNYDEGDGNYNEEYDEHINDDINSIRLSSDGTYIGLDGKIANIDNTMGHFRSLLDKFNVEFPQLIFNDGDSRSLEDLFGQINADYEKLKKAGYTDKQLEEISDNEQIVGAKSIFKSRVWLNELPFKIADIPLQYLDNDKRTNEQICDDIFEHIKMSNQIKYTKSQRRKFLKTAKEDMSTLKRRMSENMYIDKMQRTVNNNVAANQLDNGTTVTNNEKQENIDNKEKVINNINQEKTDNKKVEEHNKNSEKNREETKTNNLRIKEKDNIKNKQKSTSMELKYTRKEKARTDLIEEKEGENNTARRIALGLNNVRKNIQKPVWDEDHSDEFNKKRLVKNIVKATTGFAVGVTTATIQAGISGTDGKYNIMEGAGSLIAGAVGGAKIIDTAESMKEKTKDKETILEYSKTWYDRDDVIQAYNDEYNNRAKELRERARTQYVVRGIVDFNEQKQVMKFADELIREGRAQDDADRIAVATLQYKQRLIRESNYTMLYDNKRRDRYIEAKIEKYTGNMSKESIRNRHIEFIENVRKFDRINNT